MEALTERSLVAEVAGGTFSFKNKISASAVKMLWEKLARFVADSLKQQKGVLLPNLGTFSVGPVVGEIRKKVRMSFALLETRYAGISQERPKYSIGGRCPVVQPNYGLLATASAVHRGACQRLVLELMQRLGVHLLSGRPIQVAFPGLGRLHTNRAGRIQFDFDPLLREFFALERERVIPEMEQGAAAAMEDRDPPVNEVVKGLQQVHLHDPPALKSRPSSSVAACVPRSPMARVKRNAHAPYKGELMDLWRLCKSNDRISSGCVPRLQLEQWLYKECKQVLRQVAASTVLQLLATNTYGKTGKHILYKPFLDQLELAILKEDNSPRRARSPMRVVEVRIDGPSSVQRRQQQQHPQDEDEDETEVAEVTLSPGQRVQEGQQSAQWADEVQYPAQSPYPPLGQLQPQGYYPSPQYHSVPNHPQHQTPQQFPILGHHGQPLQQHTPQGQQHVSPGQGQYQHQGQVPQSGQQQLQAQQAGRTQAVPSSQKLPNTPGSTVQAWQGQDPGLCSGSSGSKPYHYYQNQLSPRSRRDFDNFNRLHFEKLQQIRGSDYKHRAVTPKVGEDELNLQEYQAMRQVPNALMPAEVLKLEEDRPYSNEPHPVVSMQRQRGSPGPKPQILTLAHEPPSSSRVPVLPTHQYRLHQQAATPQPSCTGRNSTPLQWPHAERQLTPTEDDSPPISQYDIINESNPIKRQQKRNELANALNRKWSEQIREKEVVLENLAEAQAHWPYVPTHQPNDKRPADAVSRPLSAWAP
ncbi:hypothetical protein Vretimale_4330 [Volvox reticuliferus]|uniref:CCDC81 HU domain-containing protein n=1 Tax=Volvox reticuliferus TaxID=1737510 RepID=A0A8J4G192_9CHLO|nr:hypothetical protein Vretifemale_2916 [Volvox reticuliferus]GIL99073.1 hypothetical protein Vretimale_4330 [Volvox reticuliferus]